MWDLWYPKFFKTVWFFTFFKISSFTESSFLFTIPLIHFQTLNHELLFWRKTTGAIEASLWLTTTECTIVTERISSEISRTRFPERKACTCRAAGLSGVCIDWVSGAAEDRITHTLKSSDPPVPPHTLIRLVSSRTKLAVCVPDRFKCL